MMSFSVFQSYPKCEVSSSQTSSLWISEWIMTIMSESCNVGGKPAGKVLIKKVARLLLTSALISAEFIAPQWKFQGWEEKVSESTIFSVPRRHNLTLPLAAQIGTTFFTFFPLLVATRLDDDCVLMTITALDMTLVTPRNVSDKLGEKKKHIWNQQKKTSGPLKDQLFRAPNRYLSNRAQNLTRKAVVLNWEFSNASKSVCLSQQAPDLE